MPNDPEWLYIHQAADTFVKQLTDGVELVLKDLQKEIDISDIEKAIQKKDPAYLVNIVDWEDNFDDKLLKTYTKVADSIMAITGTEAWKRLKTNTSFNIRNPYAELYIAEHGAELMTVVSEETKAAIRAVVLDGFQSGFPPREMARRIKNMIGLTERDARAALRYWQALAGDKELSSSQVNTMSDGYAERLLRRRALNISRTETINAANQGTLNSWRTAQDDGFILPETEKEWVAATQSDRTCIHCMPMDGQKVGLNEKFKSKTLGIEVNGPTLHPSCRCAIALVTPRIS